MFYNILFGFPVHEKQIINSKHKPIDCIVGKKREHRKYEARNRTQTFNFLD